MRLEGKALCAPSPALSGIKGSSNNARGVGGGAIPPSEGGSHVLQGVQHPGLPVTPVVVTNKSVQRFSRVAHSWKTIGFLLLVRARLWEFVRVGRDPAGAQGRKTGKFCPANQGRDFHMDGRGQCSRISLQSLLPMGLQGEGAGLGALL